MKTLGFALAAVSVAVMGSIAAPIVMGGRLFEPTVVPDPYTSGLRYDEERRARAEAPAKGPRARPPAGGAGGPACDLQAGTCWHEASPGGPRIALGISPRPVRAMAELDLEVAIEPPVPGEVQVTFSMGGMYMGENRVALAPASEGRWRGRGVLVRCPSGRRDWMAEVTVRPSSGAPLVSRFAFVASE